MKIPDNNLIIMESSKINWKTWLIFFGLCGFMVFTVWQQREYQHLTQAQQMRQANQINARLELLVIRFDTLLAAP